MPVLYDNKNTWSYSFIFFIKHRCITCTLSRKTKRKKNEANHQSPIMLPNSFRNILYSEIYLLANFVVQIQSCIRVIKNGFVNLWKTSWHHNYCFLAITPNENSWRRGRITGAWYFLDLLGKNEVLSQHQSQAVVKRIFHVFKSFLLVNRKI